MLVEADDFGDSVMPTLITYELPAGWHVYRDGDPLWASQRVFGGRIYADVGKTGRVSTIARRAADERDGRVSDWLPSGTLPPGLRWITITIR